MRPAAIAITGFVFLVLIFTGVVYVQLALLCLSMILFLPIVIGFIWQGHKARAFLIPVDRKRESDDFGDSAEPLVNIEGRTFHVRHLPSRLEFTIRCRNLHVLAAVAFIAVGALLACFLGSDSLLTPIDQDTPRYFEFYLLCYFMVILLIPALVWFSECALMRSTAITLATIQRHSKGWLSTLRVAYQFVDPQGGYHGGSVIDFGGPKGDQLKVVFCNPANPDVNKLSCGLLFHKVAWAESSQV